MLDLAASSLTVVGDVDVRGQFRGHDLAVHEGTLRGTGAGTLLECEDCRSLRAPIFALAVQEGARGVLRRTAIEDVRAVGTHAVAVRGRGKSSILLEEVWINGVEGHGVAAIEGSELEVHAVEIANASSPYIDVFGFFVASGSWGWGDDVTVRDVQGFGVAVEDADLDLDRVDVSGVWAPHGLGPGLVGQLDSTIVIRDLTAEGNEGAAVVVGAGAEIRLEGGVIDGTLSSNGELPMDLAALPGGSLTAVGVELRSAGAVGAVVHAGLLTLEDCWLGPSSTGGVWSVQGGVAHLSGVLVEGRTGVGVGVDYGLLVAEGLAVVGTRRPRELKLAAGAASVRGGELHLVDTELRDTEGYGLLVEGSEGHCTACEVTGSWLAGVLCANDAVCSLTDSTVSGVSPEGASSLAMGVFVGAGGGEDAVVTASGLVVEDAGHAAVWVETGRFIATDSVLAGGPGIELLPGVLAYGHGVYVRDGEALLADTLLLDAQGAGLFSHAGYAEFDGVLFQDNAMDVILQACDEREIRLPADIDARVCLDVDEPVVPMSYYGIVELSGAG